MSQSYKIERRRQYLKIEVFTNITLEDFKQAYADVAASDQEQPLPRLWILPDQMPDELAEEFSFERMQQLVPAGMQHNVAGKAALVSAGDLMFGKARQGALLRPDDPERFAAFRTEAEALAWLGVDESD